MKTITTQYDIWQNVQVEVVRVGRYKTFKIVLGGEEQEVGKSSLKTFFDRIREADQEIFGKKS